MVDLATLLIKMGARIEGAGTSQIRIQGVPRLHGAEHSIIPDPNKTGIFLIAAAITGGDVVVKDCEPADLRSFGRESVRQARRSYGGRRHSAGMRAQGPRERRCRDRGHPGFATDLQAQFMALMTQARGRSVITETIFENRSARVGAGAYGVDISIDGNKAIVTGPVALSGAPVIASDLRASASLVLAALAASGETIVDRVYHMDRGYEKIETKLSGVGAHIKRIKDTLIKSTAKVFSRW